jgi:hypothetical protein
MYYFICTHKLLLNIVDNRNRRVLGYNRDKSLKSFPPCYSQSPSPLLTDFTPPPPLEQIWVETGLYSNVNIVYRNLMITLKIMPSNRNEILRP